MTNQSLARSCLVKARARLKILPVLLAAYSDVVREAQEIVELSPKGVLRQGGIEPPPWHDVGGLLIEFAERFPTLDSDQIERAAIASAWLGKEREFSFDGDIDAIPTEHYSEPVARQAIAGAEEVVRLAATVIVG